MAMIIEVDFVFNTLVEAVSEWYDKYYMDTPEEINARKETHIQTLKSLYEPKRFRESVDINKEKEEFLTEVHAAVEIISTAVYG